MSKPPRVHLFSELYPPDESSTARLMGDLATGLSGDGYEWVVHTARRVDALDDEVVKGVRVVRRGVCSVGKKGGLVSRVGAAIRFALGMFWTALFEVRKGEVCLVVTNPPPLPYVVFLACLLKGGRCWVLVHDVYPEVLAAVGVLSGQSLLYRVLLLCSGWLHVASEGTIVLGRDMERRVRAKSGRSMRVEIVPNWVDERELNAVEKRENRLLREHGLSDRFVLLMGGTMGRTHDPFVVIEAARLTEPDERIHWLLIGWGYCWKDVKQRVQEYGLSNLTCLERLPEEDRTLSACSCDVAVVSYRAGMSGLSVPSRLPPCMAVGKPYLAVMEEDAEAAVLAKEHGVGWHVRVGDAAMLADEARRIANNRNEVEAASIRAKELAREMFAIEVCLARYRKLLMDRA